MMPLMASFSRTLSLRPSTPFKLVNLQKNFISLGSVSLSETQLFDKLSKHSYWKSKYKDVGNNGFEWFLNSQEASEPVLKHIKHTSVQGIQGTQLNFLDLGCGLSDLTLELLTSSSQPFKAVLVDFVPEALQYQNRKWTEYKLHHKTQAFEDSNFQLVCADVQALPFDDNSFDIILDKGTMDALMKDPRGGKEKSTQMMSEALRVLSPGARYLQISDEDPDSRMTFLEGLSQAIESAADFGADTLFCKGAKTDDKCEFSYWKFEIIEGLSGCEYFLYSAEKRNIGQNDAVR